MRRLQIVITDVPLTDPLPQGGRSNNQARSEVPRFRRAASFNLTDAALSPKVDDSPQTKKLRKQPLT